MEEEAEGQDEAEQSVDLEAEGQSEAEQVLLEASQSGQLRRDLEGYRYLED